MARVERLQVGGMRRLVERHRKHKSTKPHFYLEEIWIEGWGNMDYPPMLVLKKRLWGPFGKTLVDFGILNGQNMIEKYAVAERYCHLLNIRCVAELKQKRK